MTFSEWLSKEGGRVKLVAERFGITPSAVTQWRTNGVPATRMLDVLVLTGGEVTAEELLLGRGAPPRDEPTAAQDARAA
jgi:DNA-binding transcriptional regulator YdaS (Cro superfamily)